MTIILFALGIFINIRTALLAPCQKISGRDGLWFTTKDGMSYPCASTTRYWDAGQGACGCGNNSAGFPWNYQLFTAGGSPQLFGNGTWCGSGCGACYNITPTDYSPLGKGAQTIKTLTVMITNLCNSGNWCSAPFNSYGYGAHFNLIDYNLNGNITALGWDNPEVYYQRVECPSNYSQNYSQCQCKASNSSGSGANSSNNTSGNSSSSTNNTSNGSSTNNSSKGSSTNNSTNNSSIQARCSAITGKDGMWYTYSGITYPCATTTRYYDGSKGACGCGNNNNVASWQYTTYTAAASAQIFGKETWCGMGCGICFQVQPTGYSPEGKGTTNLEPITLMVTNLCPDAGWCTSPINKFGYGAHFDMMDQNMNGLISKRGWDNAEVFYFKVDCPSSYSDNWKTCECLGKTANYTGPIGPSGAANGTNGASGGNSNSSFLIVALSALILLILV